MYLDFPSLFFSIRSSSPLLSLSLSLSITPSCFSLLFFFLSLRLFIEWSTHVFQMRSSQMCTGRRPAYPAISDTSLLGLHETNCKPTLQSQKIFFPCVSLHIHYTHWCFEYFPRNFCMMIGF
jgi:hypothetical protein